jgi:hypothetical protein
MKISILTDDGKTIAFDTADIQTGLTGLSAAARADASKGLKDVADILAASDHDVIASIKADVQAVVWRIESELGAHPAFTWAQTKLSNAAAHLEHYVKGIWTEPDQKVAAMVVRDVRGVILSVTPPPPRD